ncbi:MAG: Ig-like domain-containing protein [Gemmatimonadota bacterium]|nr:Ig-like domain-containing protein [Gemmatimonadota bacterium]
MPVKLTVSLSSMVTMINRISVPVAVLALAFFWTPAQAQSVAQIQVVPQSLELFVGASEEVLVTAYASNGNVVPSAQFRWESSDASVVEAQGDPAVPNIGRITGVGPGDATVFVSSGSARFGIQVSIIGSVGPVGVGPAVGVEIQPNPVLLLPTEELQLVPRFIRQDGQLAAPQRLQWQSLRPDVAAVNERGVVIGISAGQGVIQANGPNFVQRVVVQVANESFGLSRRSLSMSPASVDSVGVIVPGQGNRSVSARQVQWRTGDPNVALVTPAGVVTAVSSGQTDITALAFGQQQRVRVVVHREVANADLFPRTDRGPVRVPLGGSQEFEIVFLDDNDQPIPEVVPRWTITNPAVVEFSTANHTAQAKEIGTATLTMTGPSGINATWEIEVIAGGLRSSADRLGLSKGESKTLTVSMLDTEGALLGEASDVTWASSNPSVATVTEGGRVTGVDWGYADIVGTTPWGAADTVETYIQGSLLATRFPDGNGDLFALDPSNPEQRNQLTSQPVTEITPVYSPDGTKIAFVSVTDMQKIFVMNSDGTDIRQVSNEPMSEGSPSWTRDGMHLVFESGNNLWITDLDGGNLQQLTNDELPKSAPAVSPDGSTIAYVVTNGSDTDIWVVDIDGSNPRAVLAEEGRDFAPAWFPDGQLGYISDRGTGRQRVRTVMRRNLSTGDAGGLSPSTLQVQEFAVSADGSTLAVTVQVDENSVLIRKLFLIGLTGPQAGVPVEVPRADPSEQFFFPSFRR